MTTPTDLTAVVAEVTLDEFLRHHYGNDYGTTTPHPSHLDGSSDLAKRAAHVASVIAARVAEHQAEEREVLVEAWAVRFVDPFSSKDSGQIEMRDEATARNYAVAMGEGATVIHRSVSEWKESSR